MEMLIVTVVSTSIGILIMSLIVKSQRRILQWRREHVPVAWQGISAHAETVKAIVDAWR